LEDDFIPLASRAAFVLVWARGWGYGWLLGHLSICFALHILRSPQCCFFFDLIQTLTFNFLTCECGHKLDAFGMHLFRCPFGGQ